MNEKQEIEVLWVVVGAACLLFSMIMLHNIFG